MLIRRTGVILAAVFGLFALASCVQIPQQGLKSYTDAYAQARSATEQVMTDLVAAREQLQAYQLAKARTLAPEKRGDYVPLTQRQTKGRDAIGTRLASLALINEYNGILVAIAEGNNPRALTSLVDGALDVTNQLTRVAKVSAAERMH